MIKRIKINGYKSFKDLDIELGNTVVMIGANAAGKSNFLDALNLVSRAVTCKNLKDSFDGHRGLPGESFFYGDCGRDAFLKKEFARASFEIDVELSDKTVDEVEKIIFEKRKNLDGHKKDGDTKKRITERLLRYYLEIEILPRTRVVRVVDERLSSLSRNLEEKRSKNAFFEKVSDKGRDVISLRMEGQAHPIYFDIGLDHTVVSTALYEPHYPHTVAFRKELEGWMFYYLEPKQLMRQDSTMQAVEKLEPQGKNLSAFLYSLKKADFKVLQGALSNIIPSITQLEVAPLPDGQIGYSIIDGGSTYSSRLISEGTLRVIGLLAAMNPDSPATLIGYEEPENGVHPARLRQIADILKNVCERYGKQLIINTHSVNLPTYFDMDCLYMCRRGGGGVTEIKKLNPGGELFRESAVSDALEDRIIRGDYGG